MPALDLPILLPALPEILLAAAAMTLLMVGAIRGEGSSRLVSWLAIGVLIVILIVVESGSVGVRIWFYGVFVTDAFARFMKALVLIGSAGPIPFWVDTKQQQGDA